MLGEDSIALPESEKQEDDGNSDEVPVTVSNFLREDLNTNDIPSFLRN